MIILKLWCIFFGHNLTWNRRNMWCKTCGENMTPALELEKKRIREEIKKFGRILSLQEREI